MLFNSFEFVLFFPIVTLLYFLLPHKFRWAHLLFASCLFYMAFVPVYILILFFTIFIDYWAGILIENAKGVRRKWYLGLSLIANIGVLAIFKYYNFFIENFNHLFISFGSQRELAYLEILLPIGLSFHTFQAMSYTFEVYYGRQKAEKHFGIYSLYVMYYPQLVAGPIERPQNILHQFRIPHRFESARVTDGLILMLWGMLKKVVVADRLALFADRLFNTPENYKGLGTLIGIVFFSFQIYCDFSAYSDIARGASRVMGIELMENFKQPYFARSIHEFWQRWHISLSSWFREYLYIPLGGNRKGVVRWLINLMIVFLVSGFWHGASWNFVIWGSIHGILTMLYAFFFLRKDSPFKNFEVPSLLGYVITFSLVSIAWVFFRATSFSGAINVLNGLISGWSISPNLSSAFLDFSFSNFLLCVLLILLVLGVDLIQERIPVSTYIISLPKWKRYGVYYTALMLIFLLGVYVNSSFIYFQF